MILNLLLAAVFFISMQVQGSAREFDNIAWQADVNDFVVDLSLNYSESIDISFRQVPGRSLVLNVEAPSLIRDARKVELFLLTSPIKTNESRQLLASVQRESIWENGSAGKIALSDNAELLIDRMAQGDWAILSVESSAGVVREFELPAIDFYQSYQEFDRLKNALPPIGWDDARHVVILFPLGGSDLSVTDKRLLRDLLAYMRADDRVTSMTIDGHTDASGYRLSNLTLSASRAEAVKRYLLDAGLDEEVLQAVRHHGQRFPVSGASAGQLRRVEIQLNRSDVPAGFDKQL